MKIWSKPEVCEQEAGLEVTSYLPPEIDVIGMMCSHSRNA